MAAGRAVPCQPPWMQLELSTTPKGFVEREEGETGREERGDGEEVLYLQKCSI